MKKKYNFIMPLMLLGIFVYGLYRIFFSISTNSDVLIEEVWSRAILNRGLSAWYDLLFTFSPAFFPDFLGYFISKALFNTSPLITVYITTIFQVLCLMAGIWMLLLALDVNKLKAFFISILIINFLLLFSAYYPGMWLWYYSTNDNLGATILGFYCLALVISILKSHPGINVPVLLKWVVLFFLNAFAIINGRLFILTFFAPAVVTLIILTLYFLIQKQKKVALLLGFVALNLCVSYQIATKILEPLVNPHSTLQDKLNSSSGIKKTVNNLLECLKDIFISSEILEKILVVFCLFMLGFTIVYCIKYLLKWHKEDRNKFNKQLFFHLFLLLAIGANFCGPIVAGMFGYGLPSFRYFSTLILLPLTYFVLLVVNHYSGFKYFSFFLLAMACILSKQNHRNIDEILQKKPYSHEGLLAQCVDKYAQKYHLQLGISDYWNSYPIAFLSHRAIWINPVCNTIEPCVSLDRGSYVTPPIKNTSYNFVIVSNNPQFEFTEAHLKQKLPKPDVELLCFDSIKIYVYDRSEAIFNKAIQQAMEPFLFRYGQLNNVQILNDQWIDLHEWKPGVKPFIDKRTAQGWNYGAYRSLLSVGKYPAVPAIKKNPVN